MKAGSGDHSMVSCGIQCGIPIVSCCSHSCGFSSYIYIYAKRSQRPVQDLHYYIIEGESWLMSKHTT